MHLRLLQALSGRFRFTRILQYVCTDDEESHMSCNGQQLVFKSFFLDATRLLDLDGDQNRTGVESIHVHGLACSTSTFGASSIQQVLPFICIDDEELLDCKIACEIPQLAFKASSRMLRSS